MADASSATGKVGPVLIAGTVADAVIAAIRAENTNVEILERGSYARVLVPRACRVTRAAIERELGGNFALPMDLERVMTSFAGKFRVDGEEASWTW